MLSSIFEALGVVFTVLIVIVLALVGLGVVSFGTFEEEDHHGQ